MKIKIRKLVIFSGTLFRWFELLINYYNCFTLFFKVGTMSGNLVVSRFQILYKDQRDLRQKTWGSSSMVTAPTHLLLYISFTELKFRPSFLDAEQVQIFIGSKIFKKKQFINEKFGIWINYAHLVDNFKSFYNKSGLRKEGFLEK